MGDEPNQDRYAGSLESLYEATSRQVLAYAVRRAARSEDAEEVAAETFAIAWRRLSDAPAYPLPWLYGIARRVLANQRRSADRRGRLRDRLFGHARHEAHDVRTEGGPALAALARLRGDDQELLRLVAWEDLDHRAIAQVLGISVNAVAVRLHRARNRFAEQFREVSAQDMKDSAASRTSVVVTGGTGGRESEDVT